MTLLKRPQIGAFRRSARRWWHFPLVCLISQDAIGDFAGHFREQQPEVRAFAVVGGGDVFDAAGVGRELVARQIVPLSRWHSPDRTPELMKILLEYGAPAKAAIPELKQIADSLDKDPKNYFRANFPKQAQSISSSIRETIPALEAL